MIETNLKNNQSVICISDLHKSFGKDNEVLKGINLTVNKGENVVVTGKSGSGKSILIKCLVGLIEADKGELMVLDNNISNLDYKSLNALRIQIGFLFQNAALYDSMTVGENLEFPLKRLNKELSASDIKNKVNEVLENVGLKEAIDKMPVELSGGMKKRAALARTLILNPQIILYDEPTTGLDTITSKEISMLINNIQSKTNASAIIITHDMSCAKLTSNRIAILKDGIIYSEGTYNSLEKSTDESVSSFFN